MQLNSILILALAFCSLFQVGAAGILTLYNIYKHGPQALMGGGGGLSGSPMNSAAGIIGVNDKFETMLENAVAKMPNEVQVMEVAMDTFKFDQGIMIGIQTLKLVDGKKRINFKTTSMGTIEVTATVTFSNLQIQGRTKSDGNDYSKINLGEKNQFKLKLYAFPGFSGCVLRYDEMKCDVLDSKWSGASVTSQHQNAVKEAIKKTIDDTFKLELPRRTKLICGPFQARMHSKTLNYDTMTLIDTKAATKNLRRL